MVDSVVLLLRKGEYTLEADNKLDGARAVQKNGLVFSTRYCHRYYEEQRKKHRYFPMIEGTRHGIAIQISLPKLLWGLNLYEIIPSDLPRTYEAIRSVLAEVGITTTVENVRNAVLKRIDFCKNLTVPIKFGEVNAIIHRLAQFNYKFRSDFREVLYSVGEGASIKFWNGAQGFAIYDKVGQILAEPITEAELAIVRGVQQAQGGLQHSVLRLEQSLQKKQPLEQFLRSRIPGKAKDFILEDVLHPELIKTILLEQYDSIFTVLPPHIFSLAEMKDNEILLTLDRAGLSPAEKHKIFYWTHIATQYGTAGTLEKMKQEYHGGALSRLKDELGVILAKVDIIQQGTPDLVNDLRTRLVAFEPFRHDMFDQL